jgi:hypothetical protein
MWPTLRGGGRAANFPARESTRFAKVAAIVTLFLPGGAGGAARAAVKGLGKEGLRGGGLGRGGSTDRASGSPDDWPDNADGWDSPPPRWLWPPLLPTLGAVVDRTVRWAGPH